MNSEIECLLIKMSNDTVSPKQLVDDSDFGVKKIQIFSSRDISIKAKESITISTGLSLKCEISPDYINKFFGVLELFVTLDADTFHTLDSNSLFHRMVLLTPKVKSISLEIEIPHLFNNSNNDICIKRLDSIGFLQFVIRGIPVFHQNLNNNKKNKQKKSINTFCEKCQKSFSSCSNYTKHLKRKHVSFNIDKE